MSQGSEKPYYVLSCRKNDPHCVFFVPFLRFSLLMRNKEVRNSKVCAACPEFFKQPLYAGRAAVKSPPNLGPLLNPIRFLYPMRS